jgi:hypothetical protein
MSLFRSSSPNSISPDDEEKLAAMREGRITYLKKEFRERVRNFFYTLALHPDDIGGPIDIALQVDRNRILIEVTEELLSQMRKEFDAQRQQHEDPVQVPRQDNEGPLEGQ